MKIILSATLTAYFFIGLAAGLITLIVEYGVPR